ncbi:helix-turn-helix transcriptional regulator [Chryseobacterium sp. FH2]|uniref:helix-turn-helix transcriptional regulator n=1 Tax=Chryseobacterium sp. FH2 TaxID=1674291 RepID=UPI000A42F208|nr:helix-turn-helix transcriptional regulator [Chryseobacterium sp. FH2]
MKNFLLSLLFLTFFFQICGAQHKPLNENEIQKQYDYLAQQEHNEKYFKAVLLLYKASQKINYQEGIIRGADKLTDYYFTVGDYQKAITFNEEAKKLAEKLGDAKALSNVHNNRSVFYSMQGFETESFKENRLSLKFAGQIKDPDQRHFSLSMAYNNMAARYTTFKKPKDSILLYLKKSLNEAEQINDAKKWYVIKYDRLIFQNSNIGNFYTGVHTPPRLDLAEPYYLKALEYQKAHPEISKKTKMQGLNFAGRFYVEKGNYKKATELSQEVLELEKNNKNPRERMIAYMNLANSYEELKDTALQAKYTSLFSYLNDSLNMTAKLSVNKGSQQIMSVEKNKFSQTTRNIIWVVAGALLLIATATYISWKNTNKKLYTKYEALIKKISFEKEKKVTTSSEMKRNSSFNIPDETVSALLAKLEKFENTEKYLKKGTDLSSLAHQLNTNPKYLSEVIKQHKGKNFNSYINGLKINYITKKLYEDSQYRQYKISHLAELCGFSSRDVFTSTFKKETGMSPSYIISQLNNEKNETKE